MSDHHLNSYTYEPAGGDAPKQLVVLLHGLGSNGQDLISLAPFFARDMPHAVFVSPDAPFPYDMAPVGYQWFPLQDRTPAAKLKGVQAAHPILKSFLEKQMGKYDIGPENTILCGFSQGTMMSLYTAPRLDSQLAGILGYSGALIWEDDTDTHAMKKSPVQLIHGDADDVVPLEAYFDAKKTLENAGFDVSGYICKGLAHSIDETGIQKGTDFIKKSTM